MGQPRLNIPAIVAVVLAISVFGLLFELFTSAARGEPVDAVAAGGFFTLAGSSLTILGGFWIRNSDPRPPSDSPPSPDHRPKVEETGDAESDAWNRERGWLELRWPRWKPC